MAGVLGRLTGEGVCYHKAHLGGNGRHSHQALRQEAGERVDKGDRHPHVAQCLGEDTRLLLLHIVGTGHTHTHM